MTDLGHMPIKLNPLINFSKVVLHRFNAHLGATKKPDRTQDSVWIFLQGIRLLGGKISTTIGLSVIPEGKVYSTFDMGFPLVTGFMDRATRRVEEAAMTRWHIVYFDHICFQRNIEVMA